MTMTDDHIQSAVRTGVVAGEPAAAPS